MDVRERDSYEKGGDAGKQGTDFQISVLTMVFLNGMKKGHSWRLSSENKSAGKFDDVVMEYINPSAEFLIQTKHKQKPNAITYNGLISDSPNEFCLPMYFLSYQDIKQKFAIQNITICTNSDIRKCVREFVNKNVLNAESPLHLDGRKVFYYTFKESFVNDFKQNVDRYYAKNCRGKETDALEGSIREFFSRLQLVVSYPTGEDIHHAFERVISTIEFAQGLDYKLCSDYVHKRINTWYIRPVGTYLTEAHGRAFFCEIRSSMYCNALKSYDIAFKNTDVPLKGSNARVLHIIPEQEHILNVIKIFQGLQRQDMSKILFMSKDEKVEIQLQFVYAFTLPVYTYLVIECVKAATDDIVQEMYNRLVTLLNKIKYKTVILIAEEEDGLAKRFKHSKNSLGIIEAKKEKLEFCDLTEDSQERFGRMSMLDFQGREMSLNELLPGLTNEELNDYLNEEVLIKFAKKEKIVVGMKVSTLDDTVKAYYISRTFNRNGENISEEKMCQYVHSSKEKTIVISDSPGMGKTTVLTSLASAIKETNPSLWVMRININNYTDILRQSKKKNLDYIPAKELLNSRQTSSIITHLEKKVFSLRKKVVLMIDGADEASPEYKEIILNFIAECKRKSNFAKIFITTRPHLGQEIERVLKVAAWSLEPFSKKNQADFLEKYWITNLGVNDAILQRKCNVYVQTLITETSRSITDSFEGIALQTKLLAEVFQSKNTGNEVYKWETCDEFLTSNDEKPKLLNKLSVTSLFEMFISKKCDTFIKYYKLSNSQKILKECKSYHLILALETILRRESCTVFDYYKEKAGENMDEEYPLKLGVVQKIDGKMCFTHRMFADYFVAKCLIKQLKHETENEEFLNFLINEILLGEYQYNEICTFLDKFLTEEMEFLPTKVCERIGVKMNCELGHHILFELTARGFEGILKLIFKSFDATEASIDINAIEAFDGTLLHRACRYKNADIIRFLIKRGAKLNTINNKGLTPVHVAALQGNLGTVKYLMRNGAEINSIFNSSCTALYQAASSGNLDVVKYLVENGANVNSTSMYGSYPLHAAVTYAHDNSIDIVKYLVENGADINSISKDGRTTLLKAVVGNNLTIIKFLVENGANVNSECEDGRTALLEAASRDNLDVVEYLLEKGADVNSRTRDGGSALIKATIYGNLNMVKCLVEHGANVNSKYEDGSTALFEAASRDNLNIVEYLLQNGANVNSRTHNGACALVRSVVHGNLSMVKCLLENGANVNSRSRNGRIVLFEAISRCNLGIVECLLEKGADVTSRTKNGVTVLVEAASRGWLNIVKCILEKSADVKCGIENDRIARIALESIFSRENCKLFDCYKENRDENMDEMLLLELGVIKNIDDSLCFTHKTFAAYFVAKCMIKQLQCEGDNEKFLSFLVTQVLLVEYEISTFLDQLLLEEMDYLSIKVCKNIELRLNNEVGYHVLFGLTTKGFVGILNFLLKCLDITESGFDISAIEAFDGTLLHRAARYTNLHIIYFLLERGVKINAVNNKGLTALHVAALEGNLDTVKYLIQGGAEINRISNKSCIAIYQAALGGNLDVVKYLIEKGANVNGMSKYGSYSLHAAVTCVCNRKIDVVKCLVENGADINSRSKYGRTALIKAVVGNNLIIVKYLLENGANVNSRCEDGTTALYLATSLNNLDTVELLLEKGADVNSRTQDGLAALAEAAFHGNLNMVKCLLEYGADVNSRSKNGRTALLAAVSQNNLDVVKYLLEKGADVNSRTRKGESALFMAVKNNAFEAVKCLLENGADVNSKSKSGKTALFECAAQYNLDIVKYLLEKGANINSRTNTGTTVFLKAAALDNLIMVQFLLENGANVNDRTEDGISALIAAIARANLNTVKYLLKRGACEETSTASPDDVDVACSLHGVDDAHRSKDSDNDSVCTFCGDEGDGEDGFCNFCRGTLTE